MVVEALRIGRVALTRVGNIHGFITTTYGTQEAAVELPFSSSLGHRTTPTLRQAFDNTALQLKSRTQGSIQLSARMLCLARSGSTGMSSLKCGLKRLDRTW